MKKKINLEKCESFCNEKQVFPAMRTLVNDHGMKIREASREVEKQTKGAVTATRADSVYRSRALAVAKVKPKAKGAASAAPTKKKPKTESTKSNGPYRNKPTVKDHPTVGAAIVHAIKDHWARRPETTEREVVDACIHCYSATRGYFGVAGNYTVSEMVSAGADQTAQEKKRHKENKKEETRIFNLVKKKLASHKK